MAAAPFPNLAGFPPIDPDSCCIRDVREAMLTFEIEALAALRYSILLTIRWENLGGESPEQRAELRADLALLRRQYGDKIDEIAMVFGVDAAMRTKENVERTVLAPGELSPLLFERTEEVGSEWSAEWGGDTGYGI